MKIYLKIRNKISLPTFIILFFIFTPSSVCNAATINVPKDYSTIQAAIEACSCGDIIVVSDGNYRQERIFINKPIIIKSVNGPESTIIDIEQSILITSGCVTIDGFTIKTPGRDNNCPAIEVITNDTVNVVISNNRIVGRAIGAVISGSSSNQQFGNIGLEIDCSASQHNKIINNKFTHGEKGNWIYQSDRNVINDMREYAICFSDSTRNQPVTHYITHADDNVCILIKRSNVLNDNIVNRYNGDVFVNVALGKPAKMSSYRFGRKGHNTRDMQIESQLKQDRITLWSQNCRSERLCNFFNPIFRKRPTDNFHLTEVEELSIHMCQSNIAI